MGKVEVHDVSGSLLEAAASMPPADLRDPRRRGAARPDLRARGAHQLRRRGAPLLPAGGDRREAAP